MSCEVNTIFRENLTDKVSSMTVDEFITALEDNNISGSNAVDNLIIALVDKMFEDMSQ